MKMLLVTLAVAVSGMALAAGLGYAAYLASRDSVGVPVTKLEPSPGELAPRTTRARRPVHPVRKSTAVATTTSRTGVTTTDDHRGRSRGGSGGGHGGDD